MDAYVYATEEGYAIAFVVDGRTVDEADGFDDELEAVLAARRNVYGIGTVLMGSL
jgi:hypothetical protein